MRGLGVVRRFSENPKRSENGEDGAGKGEIGDDVETEIEKILEEQQQQSEEEVLKQNLSKVKKFKKNEKNLKF